MPNWCDNDLFVDGPKIDVRAFIDFAKGINEKGDLLLDFNRFVQQPDHITIEMITDPWLKATMSDRTKQDDLWYEWRLQYWGTKWQPADARIDEEDGSWDDTDSAIRVKLVFGTAWTPPKPVVLAASTLFPTLSFELRYFESGVGFNGCYTCQDGEVECDRCGAYFGDRGG